MNFDSKKENILLMLRIGMGFVPLICMLVAYFVIKRKYTITEEKYDDMLKILNNRLFSM